MTSIPETTARSESPPGAPGADEVSWLDDTEQAAWRSYVEGMSRLRARLDDDLRCYGITLDDYEILVFLSESEDRRARMTDLAERLMTSKSRLTYRVDRLEKAGVVRRHACPTDKRGIHAELTDDGFALLEKAARTHVDGVRRHFVDHFERDEFVRMGAWFERVAASLRPHRS